MKCRVIRNEYSHHHYTALDCFGGSAVLVGTGKWTYLSIHTNNPGPKGFSALSGQMVLRKLAHAILRNVPAGRRAKDGK